MGQGFPCVQDTQANRWGGQSSGLGVRQPPLPPLVLGLLWASSEGRCGHRGWSHMNFVKLVFFFFFALEPFLFRKAKMCSSHTQEGYGLGAEVSVHPVRAPSPCRFGSNKGCGVMAPKIKMVCVGGRVGGRRGVQKHWGVVRGGLDEVSTGNAAGERPSHNVSY